MKKKFDDDLAGWIDAEADRLTTQISNLVGEYFPGQSVELPDVDIDEVSAELFALSSAMEFVTNLRKLIHTKIPVTFLLYGLSFINQIVTMSSTRLHDARSRSQRLSNSRHAENREIAERLKNWYAETWSQFKSMDAAAEAATKIEPVSFRTARKHIGEAAKYLPPARKA